MIKKFFEKYSHDILHIVFTIIIAFPISIPTLIYTGISKFTYWVYRNARK
jgi:hypothetical protein